MMMPGGHYYETVAENSRKIDSFDASSAAVLTASRISLSLFLVTFGFYYLKIALIVSEDEMSLEYFIASRAD